MVSPTLTHLVIGKEFANQNRVLRRARGNSLYDYSTKSFDLDSLRDPSVKASFSSNAQATLNSNSSSVILLPRLEKLDWSIGSSSDEELLQFVTERIDMSILQSQIAGLKRVWIAFNRVKELDVPAEFSRYRETKEAMGLDIPEVELKLEYLSKEPSKEKDSFSALSRLTPGGRTWPYDDISFE